MASAGSPTVQFESAAPLTCEVVLNCGDVDMVPLQHFIMQAGIARFGV